MKFNLKLCNMKRILCLLFSLITFVAVAQEKKPTLMLVPSDNWLTQRYYTKTFDNMGTKVRVMDYERAFQEDTELKSVIASIGQIMTDKGYFLKDCEQEMKSITMWKIENSMITNDDDSVLSESLLDQIKQHAKSDIIIYVDWSVKKDPKGRVVTFILEAFDAYTSKRIATSTSTSKPLDKSVPELLESTISANIETFDNQLTNYFNDLKENGREIVLTIRCWDNWDNDLETIYGEDELLDCIQQWLRENTVKGIFNLTDATENFAQFEQVRIPLYDKNRNAMDARTFATLLRKYLAKSPYNITSKVMVRGLGESILVLGE